MDDSPPPTPGGCHSSYGRPYHGQQSRGRGHKQKWTHKVSPTGNRRKQRQPRSEKKRSYERCVRLAQSENLKQHFTNWEGYQAWRFSHNTGKATQFPKQHPEKHWPEEWDGWPAFLGIMEEPGQEQAGPAAEGNFDSPSPAGTVGFFVASRHEPTRAADTNLGSCPLYDGPLCFGR